MVGAALDKYQEPNVETCDLANQVYRIEAKWEKEGALLVLDETHR